MTKSFKEADEKFQELMKSVNDRLIAINNGTFSNNKELKCKDNKELSLFDNVALELREIENEDNIKTRVTTQVTKALKCSTFRKHLSTNLKGWQPAIGAISLNISYVSKEKTVWKI